jgi:hypothetical protein
LRDPLKLSVQDMLDSSPSTKVWLENINGCISIYEDAIVKHKAEITSSLWLIEKLKKKKEGLESSDTPLQ